MLEALQERYLGDDVVGLSLAEVGLKDALDGDRLSGSGLAVGLVDVAVGAGAEAFREGVGSELEFVQFCSKSLSLLDEHDIPEREGVVADSMTS